MLDYIRIACAVPEVQPGNAVKNVQDICAYMEKADAQKVDILLFPELAVTGFTCGDLFFNEALDRAVKKGLKDIAAYSAKYPEMTVVVGLPVRLGGKLYNCAAAIAAGQVRGLVPKTYMDPGECRWFASGNGIQDRWLDPALLGLQQTPLVAFGPKTLFQMATDVTVGIEICQDLMTPVPASSALAVGGAQVILNLSASEELAGKRAYRRELVKHQSRACSCVYAFVSAGCTESTSDTVYSGHSLIAEDATILRENQELTATDYLLVADCDLGKLRGKRIKEQNIYNEQPQGHFLVQTLTDTPLRSDGTLYPLRKLPFIPSTKQEREERCKEIFQIQVAGLMQRLKAIHSKPVLGISGGLDSTLALLVAVEAMDRLGRPRTDVHGITMPCYGTSGRTYRNAWALMENLGITSKEISIKAAVDQHFADIGHDPAVFNTTYENAQARERTQVLMDYSGMVGGIVVGTGDLSELALGWCTYNGDHMSMYGVNGTVPKTLIRWIIETVAQEPAFAAAREVLADILDTPISPELLPPDASGKIAQKTEDLVGPYALHDFFLYHMLQYGFGPAKIYTLACRAFAQDFDGETVKKWLQTFYRRFFAQQFKRSCMPEGVKVGSVSLSPRGDWRMPGDMTSRLWLEEMETL